MLSMLCYLLAVVAFKTAYLVNSFQILRLLVSDRSHIQISVYILFVIKVDLCSLFLPCFT